MRNFVLLLLVIPVFAMADDTRCTLEVSDVRLEPDINNNRGHLSVRGSAFGNSYIPVCKLSTVTRVIGEAARPSGLDDYLVSPNLCSQWVTAAELALTLEMKITLTYVSTHQLDCETLNDSTYPYLLEVHRYEESN